MRFLFQSLMHCVYASCCSSVDGKEEARPLPLEDAQPACNDWRAEAGRITFDWLSYLTESRSLPFIQRLDFSPNCRRIRESPALGLRGFRNFTQRRHVRVSSRPSETGRPARAALSVRRDRPASGQRCRDLAIGRCSLMDGYGAGALDLGGIAGLQTRA